MRPLFALLLFALPAVAAPVPKALKKAATMDGVWELVDINGYNGRMSIIFTKPSYMRIDGDRISTTKRSVDELSREELTHTLRVRDDKQPQLRTYDTGEAKYPAVVELDGDKLRLAYTDDPKMTLTECKPASGVYLYVFKRVKEVK